MRLAFLSPIPIPLRSHGAAILVSVISIGFYGAGNFAVAVPPVPVEAPANVPRRAVASDNLGAAMLGVVPANKAGHVIVHQLFLGGPAQLAGLQPGDQLIAMDHISINTAEQFIELIRGCRPGARMTLFVNRNGRMNYIPVVLGRRDIVSTLPRSHVLTSARTERRHRAIMRHDYDMLDARTALNIYDPYLRALYTAFGQ